jgi:hypothetical protein
MSGYANRTSATLSVRRIRRLNAFSKASGYLSQLRVLPLLALPPDTLLSVDLWAHQAHFDDVPPNLRVHVWFPKGRDGYFDLPLDPELVARVSGRAS